MLALLVVGSATACSPSVSALQQSSDPQSGVATAMAAPGVVRVGEGNRACTATGDQVVCHGINAEETRGDLEEVEGLSGHVVTSLSLGRDFACAGTAEGVWCWGSNASGELGSDVVTASPLEAVQVPGVPGDVVSLASGRTHSCAATAEGVWCWGSNAFGQIRGVASEGAMEATKVEVDPLVDLSSSGFETCGVSTADGMSSLVCWGNNRWGQISPLLSAETLPPTVLAATAQAS